MKLCRSCKTEKPFGDFHKCARGILGLHAYCKKCLKEKMRDWYLRNAEKIRVVGAIAFKNATPERRARLRQLSNEYWKTHPSELAEKNARIRMTRRKACVKWRNKFFVREVYSLARLRTKLLGVIHHVDHIVPIKHPLVCGLHNEFNLTVLTQFENLSKGNRHWPDMPEELGIV